jgi:hypothetical protein
MASRTVEVSVASLAGVPLEVMVLAAVYTVGPLLIALAVFYAARRVSKALRLLHLDWRVEPAITTVPTMPMAPKPGTQDAAYEAVRDWYAVEGGAVAQTCYMLLSTHTKRHD